LLGPSGPAERPEAAAYAAGHDHRVSVALHSSTSMVVDII
jgi:hypothetical protein